jgi:hypothetical protein
VATPWVFSCGVCCAVCCGCQLKGDRPPDWMLGLAPAAIVLIFVAFYKLSQKVHNHTPLPTSSPVLHDRPPPAFLCLPPAWMPF